MQCHSTHPVIGKCLAMHRGLGIRHARAGQPVQCIVGEGRNAAHGYFLHVAQGGCQRGFVFQPSFQAVNISISPV